MTVQRTFTDWASSGLDWDKAPYEACSPNLLLVQAELVRVFPGTTSLGCHLDRPIRGGATPSEHSWGAALDSKYPDGRRVEFIEYIIERSAEFHIGMIGDYIGSRIWRAGRTSSPDPANWWKPNTTASGMGEAWATYLHLVTTIDGYGDTAPIAKRFASQPTPEPPDPPEEDDMSTAVIARFHGIANAWLVGAGAPVHLTPELYAHWSTTVPEVVQPQHPQALLTLMHQCGLSDGDLEYI